MLSHGQSDVEIGFSVNKEAHALNLKEDSLKAIHLVHDTISEEQMNSLPLAAMQTIGTRCI